MLATLQALAAVGHDEPDKTLFYVLGGALAAWAVLVAGLGIARHETFPPSSGGKKAVMGVTALLVAATMSAAVLTS